MHTSYDEATQMPVFGDPRSVMLVFNNDLGPGVTPSAFQVTLGPGSPGAGNVVQVLSVDVRRNMVFLRLNTELTLVPSIEVIAGASLRDEFGQRFLPSAVTIYGMSVSNASTGEFGSVPAGSAARIVAGGFTSGQRITVTAQADGPAVTLGNLTASENGVISGFFNIPFPAGGPYTMTATGPTGRQVTATFDVVG